jgi:hypothetical protein
VEGVALMSLISPAINKEMATRIAIAVATIIATEVLWYHRQRIYDGFMSLGRWVRQKVTGEHPIEVNDASYGAVSDIAPDDDIGGIDAILCPISGRVMIDPVITPYGHCFDRRSIEERLAQHPSCPITGSPLRVDQLVPCYALRLMVEQLLASSPNLLMSRRESQVRSA